MHSKCVFGRGSTPAFAGGGAGDYSNPQILQLYLKGTLHDREGKAGKKEGREGEPLGAASLHPKKQNPV